MSQPQGLEANLVFWKRVEGQTLEVDFTKAKPETCMAVMAEADQNQLVYIQDIRGREAQYNLEQNGFQYVWHDMPELKDVAEQSQVENVILPKTEALVRQITGATRTVTFAHRVRCLSVDEALLANNRAPAHSVHSDFTPKGALHNLESVIPDSEERAELLKRRILVINVWRPLKTVQRDPLAVCAWATVDWRRDRIANRMVLPHGWHELGKYAFHENQKWYYLRQQQPQEALIFTQFDSESERIGGGGMTLPHAAFVVPGTEKFPARESIEVKMFAFL